MAIQNDGRIPGGPTTAAILHERESHISKLVFTGERYDYPDVKLREHGEWRSSWELSAAQKTLVATFGFDLIDAIRIKRHNMDLILSIVERWWPTRNTFQLSFGEMTITLADTAQILGLPIEGCPIYFFEGLDASDIIRTYLGVEPPSDIGGRSTVRLTWLRSTFMHLDRIGDTTVVVDDSRVMFCTRAYLLCLCGALLFSDATGNMINVRLLPYLEDFGTRTKHAWGVAVLAHLYHSMTSFVTKVSGGKTAKNISGCLTLIQFWCYEHFAIGRPLTIYSDQRVYPGGLKWNTENVDYQHVVHKAVSIYRNQFDTLTAFDVYWQPQSVPEDVINTTRGMSLHRYYILYNGYIMFHPADRVMRQFGLKQIIPHDPLPSSISKANIEERVTHFLVGWCSRFTTHGIEHMSELMTSVADVLGNEDFVRWYGCPLMQNRRYNFEEPRFEARAIDDRSLREHRARVELTVQLELLYCPIGAENEFTNPFSSQYTMTSLEKALKTESNGISNADVERTTKKRDVIIRGVLSVTVISGEDLPAMDVMGKSDPYVVVSMKKTTSKNKTRVVNESLNPIWNQTFDFMVEDGLHDMLILEVWDHDTFGKDYMGRCIMTLTRVILEGEYEDSIPLDGAKSGKLKFNLKWTPQPVYRDS